MEIRWSRESSSSSSSSQWRANMRAMQRRIRERLRIPSSPHLFFFRQLHHRPSTAVACAKATGLVGARVFKANFIFPRALHSMAEQLRSSLKLSAVAASRDLPPIHPRKPLSQSFQQKEISEKAEANYTAIFAQDSHVVRLLQAVALPIIGNVCHAFMHGFNHTEVYGIEKLTDAVLHRPQGQALITVSNHVASMDDPLVLAAMLPPHLLLDAHSLRWTLCATDRCFTNPVTSAFFRCVKVLPLARGGGVYQKGIDLAVEKLKKGDWVHIFPEGSRSRDGGKTIQGAKRGIGRLVLDAGNVPLVVPFVHSGMQEVMPIGSKFPSVRKKVIVLVGDPIKMDDLIAKFRNSELPESLLHEAIAFRVGQHLKCMKAELDQLVLSSSGIVDQQLLPLSGEANGNCKTGDIGQNIAPKKGKSVQKYLKRSYDNEYEDDQSIVYHFSEESRIRKSSFEILEEGWFADSRYASGVYTRTLQEGMVTRLRDFMDPAVFVGFAAQGLLRYS